MGNHFYLSEAGLVTKVEESTDAILTRLEVEVLDEAESGQSAKDTEVKEGAYPLQRPVSRSTMALQRSILPKRDA